MKKAIAVLPGDGIGEEVVEQALRVLDAVSKRFGHTFHYEHGFIGGAGFERFGAHFPKETEELCRHADAILFGSVGGPPGERHLPKWDGCEVNSILALRKAFQFSANYRPARVYPELIDICPLRPDTAAKGVDLLIIRELVGDIYFGEKTRTTVNGRRVARDVAEYTEDQIANVAHKAFQAARNRRKRLVSVDKANVLETSRLWRAVVGELSSQYPDVALEHMFVDNCAMQIVRAPEYFDVVLTPNLFGDILSDVAAVLPGSLGLLPSASLNQDGFGMYEPAGGSAPELAGRGVANPIAQILSAAMLLDFSFGLRDEARVIEAAVSEVLAAGYRTADIAPRGAASISTSQITDQILARI